MLDLAGRVDRDLALRIGEVDLEVDRARVGVGARASAARSCRRASCSVATTWIATRACPAATTSKSISGTSTVMRTVVRSTTETIGVPGPHEGARVDRCASRPRRRTARAGCSRSPRAPVAASLARCDASCASSRRALRRASAPPRWRDEAAVEQRSACAPTRRRRACCRASMARASRGDGLARGARVAAVERREHLAALTTAPGRTRTVST